MKSVIAVAIVIMVMTALSAPPVMFATQIREGLHQKDWVLVYLAVIGEIVGLGLFLLVGYYFWITPV